MVKAGQTAQEGKTPLRGIGMAGLRSRRGPLIPVAAILAVLVLVMIVMGRPFQVEAAFSGLARRCWPDQPPYQVELTVDAGRPLAILPEEFLSFSIDTSQLVGGLWWTESAAKRESGSGTSATTPIDLASPRLRAMAKALSPAWLRVGGSEADRVSYDLTAAPSTSPGGQPNPSDPVTQVATTASSPFRAVLTANRWDELHDFVRQTGLKLDFTINAGPGPRRNGAWQADNARRLMAYTKAKGYRVDAWEFGNELNGYWAVHGWGSQISPQQYGNDFAVFAGLVRQESPGSLAIMQGSAIWPLVGEGPLSAWHFLDSRSLTTGTLTQRVNWHYYPQQSRRAPVATRRAGPRTMLDPAALDEAAMWAGHVTAWRDVWAPGKPVWLGETGNAQFGGEPGVSDTWLGGLWWLDQLGLMARSRMEIVVRQSLAGMDYGLLSGSGFNPRPDYWNSWLWKQFMGPEVYSARVAGPGGNSQHARKLRAYAHGQAGTKGGLTLLLINLDEHRTAQVSLPAAVGAGARVWQLSSPDILGGEVELNGQGLRLLDGSGEGGLSLPDPGPGTVIPAGQAVSVRPLSYVFVQWPWNQDLYSTQQLQ